MREVTDPNLLEELNRKEVTDPNVLAVLEGKGQEQKVIPQPVSEKKSYTLGEVPSAALSNLPSGLLNYAKNFIDPNTYKAIGNMISSAMPGSWLTNYYTRGEYPYSEIIKMAQNLAEQKVQSYGDWETAKRTMAENPVEPMSDLASILMGGGALIPRTGTLGQVANIASKSGQWLDPLTGTGKLIKGVSSMGKKLSSGPLGISTGAGKVPVEKAMEAGETFKKALRGGITGEETVQAAKGGIYAIKQERADLYKPRLQAMKNATITPTMDVIVPIREFVDSLKEFDVKLVKNRQGKITNLDFSDSSIRNNMPAQNDFNRIFDTLRNAYEKPVLYKTPAGFDVLKRQLYDLYSESSQGRAAVERVAQTARQELINKVPGYATMVGDYEKTTKLIQEIERDLTLGKKGSIDTALRKLNTAIREDDDFRKSLIKLTEKSSGKDISGMVSGRLMSTWMPKSWMGREIAAGTIFAGIFGNPAILPALATASPRLVAETLMLLGKGEKAIKVMASPKAAPARQGIYQTGRATNQMEE